MPPVHGYYNYIMYGIYINIYHVYNCYRCVIWEFMYYNVLIYKFGNYIHVRNYREQTNYVWEFIYVL